MRHFDRVFASPLLVRSHNTFGRAGFLAPARSPHAGGLKYLKVRGYDLRELADVKAELDARFGPVLDYA